MVKQRMIFVCGGCTHYFSAVATGATTEALALGAKQLQAAHPVCDQCGMKPPLWRFERVGQIENAEGAKS